MANKPEVIFLEFTGSFNCRQFKATWGEQSEYGVSAEEAIGRLVIRFGPERLNVLTASTDEQSTEAVMHVASGLHVIEATGTFERSGLRVVTVNGKIIDRESCIEKGGKIVATLNADGIIVDVN